jgi:hypothetical protein
MSTQTVVERFFAAMNTQDADAAAALADPNVQIVLGPHVLTGEAALRELASQEDPELVFDTVPVSIDAVSDTRTTVQAQRTSRWRESGVVAAEEDVQVAFDLDSGGLITRIELS